eukprot:sb/3460527/
MTDDAGCLCNLAKTGFRRNHSNPTLSIFASNPESVDDPVSDHESVDYPASDPESVDDPASDPESVDDPVSDPESVDDPVSDPESVDDSISGPESVDDPVSDPESVDDPVSDPESVDDPVSDPESVDDPVSDPESVDDPASESVDDPVSDPESVDDSVSDPESVDDAASDPESVDDPVSDTESVDDPASDHESVDDPVSDPESVDDPASDAESVDDPVSDAESMDDPVSDPESLDDPASDPESVDDHVSDPESVNDLATDPESSDDPVVDPESVDDPATDSESVDDPVSDPESVDDPVPDSESVDDPVSDPESVDDPVSDSESLDDPVSDPESVDDPVSDPESVDDPVSDPESVDDHVSYPESVDDPVSDPESVDDPVSDPESVDDPASDPELTVKAINSFTTDSSFTNLARTEHAVFSSSLLWNTNTKPLTHLYDGIKTGDKWCSTHGISGVLSWFIITLDKDYYLEKTVITNRDDSYGYRTVGCEVLVDSVAVYTIPDIQAEYDISITKNVGLVSPTNQLTGYCSFLPDSGVDETGKDPIAPVMDDMDKPAIISSINLARTKHAVFSSSSLWDATNHPLTNLYDGISENFQQTPPEQLIPCRCIRFQTFKQSTIYQLTRYENRSWTLVLGLHITVLGPLKTKQSTKIRVPLAFCRTGPPRKTFTIQKMNEYINLLEIELYGTDSTKNSKRKKGTGAQGELIGPQSVDDPVSDPESVDDPVSDPESVDDPVSDPESVDDPVSDPESVDDPVSDPESVDDPVSDPESVDDPVSDPESVDDPVSDPESVDDPVSDPESVDDPVSDPESVDDPVSDPESVDDPVSDPESVDDPVSDPESVDDPVSDPESVDDPVSDPESVDDPVSDPESVDDPVSDPESVDDPVSDPESVDDPVSDPESVDDPVSDPESVDDPVSDPESVDDPVSDPESVDDPVSDPESVDDPVSDPESVDDPVSDPESVDDPVSDPESVDDPASDPESVDDPVSDLDSVDDPLSDPESVDDLVSDPESVDDPVFDPESVDDPVSDPESVDDPVSDPESVDDPVSDPESVDDPVSDPESVDDPVSNSESIDDPVSDPESVDDPLSDTESVDDPVSDPESVDTQFPIPYDRVAYRGVFSKALERVLAQENPTPSETGTPTTKKLMFVTSYFKGIDNLKSFVRAMDEDIKSAAGDVQTVFALRKHPSIGNTVVRNRKLSEGHEERVPMDSQKCGSRGCKTCELMGSSTRFQTNGESVDLDMTLNCKTANVIYIAQCRICLENGGRETTYIGQTTTPLHIRFNGHRNKFKIDTNLSFEKSALSLHCFLRHKNNFDLGLFNVGIIKQVPAVELDRFEGRRNHSNPTLSIFASNPESVDDPVSDHESVDYPASDPESVDDPASDPESVDDPVSDPESVDDPVSDPESVDDSISGPESVDDPVSDPESVDDPVSDPESVDDPVSDPESVDDPVSDPESVDDPASESVDDPVSDPESVDDSVSDPESVDDAASDPESVDDPVSDTESVDDPASDHESVDDPVSDPESVDDPASDAESVDDPVSDAESMDDPVSDPESLDDPASDPESVDDHVSDPESVNDLATDPESSDDPVVDPESVDDPATDSESVDDPVSDPESVDDPVPDSESVDDPVSDPESVDDPVSDSESLDDPVSDPESVDDPVSDPESVDDPVSDPESVDDHVSYPESVDDPVSDPESVDDPVSDPESVDDPASDPELTVKAINSFTTDSSFTNLARTEHAVFSSSLLWNTNTKPLTHLYDGIKTGDKWCSTHGISGVLSWFIITLDKDYYLEKTVITNRDDSYGYRTVGCEVLVDSVAVYTIPDIQAEYDISITKNVGLVSPTNQLTGYCSFLPDSGVDETGKDPIAPVMDDMDKPAIISSINLARTKHAVFSSSSLWDATNHPLTNLYDGISENFQQTPPEQLIPCRCIRFQTFKQSTIYQLTRYENRSWTLVLGLHITVLGPLKTKQSTKIRVPLAFCRTGPPRKTFTIQKMNEYINLLEIELYGTDSTKNSNCSFLPDSGVDENGKDPIETVMDDPDKPAIFSSINLARTKHAVFSSSSLWDTTNNPLTNLYDGINENFQQTPPPRTGSKWCSTHKPGDLSWFIITLDKDYYLEKTVIINREGHFNFRAVGCEILVDSLPVYKILDVQVEYDIPLMEVGKTFTIQKMNEYINLLEIELYGVDSTSSSSKLFGLKLYLGLDNFPVNKMGSI